MSGQHVKPLLSAYCRGQLTAEEVRRVDTHLEACTSCRREYSEIRTGIELVTHLPLASPPESLWQDIESGLRIKDTKPAERVRKPRWVWLWVPASLAIIVSLSVAGWWYFRLQNRVYWEVSAVQGKPLIGSNTLEARVPFYPGEVLETDADSQARIQLPRVGTVDIDPVTRVRMLKSEPDEHRLDLIHGRMQAVIWAPPRLFFVETPSAVAIDLGCAYTLEVDLEGAGLLDVTFGWVAFQRDGRESFVPGGAICHTRPEIGPGTPFFKDASPTFQEMLRQFDFFDGGSLALLALLKESRKRDALTLWHLLSRVNTEDRGIVFDRLAELVGVPPGVTPEGILRLDERMLDAYIDLLGLEDTNWWRIWKTPLRLRNLK